MFELRSRSPVRKRARMAAVSRAAAEFPRSCRAERIRALTADSRELQTFGRIIRRPPNWRSICGLVRPSRWGGRSAFRSESPSKRLDEQQWGILSASILTVSFHTLQNNTTAAGIVLFHVRVVMITGLPIRALLPVHFSSFIRSDFRMDSDVVTEEFEVDAKEFEKVALEDEPTDEAAEQCAYGDLILLGYNGSSDSGSSDSGARPNSHGRKHRSKMTLKRREVGNGIRKGESVQITANPKQAPAVQDASRHVVSYSYNKSHTVLVEYVADETKDMFQATNPLRSSYVRLFEGWTIVGGPNRLHDRRHVAGGGRERRPLARRQQQPADHEAARRRRCRPAAIDFVDDFALQLPNSVRSGGPDEGVRLCGRLRLVAQHFPRGEGDQMAAQERRMRRPHNQRRPHSPPESEHGGREPCGDVSVDGSIYSLRETRSSNKRGSLVFEETNQLQDGTLIDLCGATLLWRSAEGLKNSPSRELLERRLDELNAGKPQCPVNLNTLIVPRKKCMRTNSSRQPYVGSDAASEQRAHLQVPDLHDRIEAGTPAFYGQESTNVSLVYCGALGMESAFHLDLDTLDYAFNPCGCTVSYATARYWSRIPLPHGTNSFHPVCPFCTTLLAIEPPFNGALPRPYVKLIFQDNCS
ncbi:hypothetical protein M3Y99_01170900 [Aphelenchoides fujianensis]|nr:hypothetical protein M3Y99_01170900 [Aphelenchoides fujianensis]